MPCRLERIAAQLQANLSAIAAGGPLGYAYTVNRCTRLQHGWEHRDLGSEDDVVYLLRQGIEFETERTSGSIFYESEFFVLAAKQWNPTNDTPEIVEAEALERYQTVANELAADVEQCVHNDVTLIETGTGTSLTWNVQVTEVDHEWKVEGYAAVVLRLIVKYEKAKGER
jgi:hypothetical protein